MTERREVGPRSQKIVARERKHLASGSQGFSLYAGLAMARGVDCTLIDEDGNEYIDWVSGIGARPLIGGHVMRRADDLSRTGFRGASLLELRQPEVGQFDNQAGRERGMVVGSAQQDVRWLDIAVDNPLRMRLLQCA